MADERHLYPRVQRFEPLAGATDLPTRVGLHFGSGIDEADAIRLEERCRAALGERVELDRTDADPSWRFALDPAIRSDSEAYELVWNEGGLRATAGGPAGLFYALQTFKQWLRLHVSREVPHVRIADRPSFRHRGVLLDVSRDRVPTMEALLRLVDRLAEWKINQLQLYTEHTFAYAGHERVWRDASPFTAEEISTLDRYCADRFIELVPNQNSLGHFHRWLVHEPYRHLAECPDGVEHPFSAAAEPFSLCPIDPAALELLAELYDQLLPHFASRQLNVGLDESFDIGRGRSARAVEARGAGRVYLDFVHEIHRLAHERGHRMQMWGDIILQHPELVAELPADVVVLNWGYEAEHPFAEETARFAAAGREFYVCPGTSSWNSLVGRASNALANLGNAAAAGREQGATGFLITDWGDFGHWQPPAASHLGLLAGACFAWSSTSADEGSEFDIGSGLDLHLYGAAATGPAASLGSVIRELGDLYLDAGAPPKNGTPPFFQLLFPDTDLTHSRFGGSTADGLRRVAERSAEAVLALESLSSVGPRSGEPGSGEPGCEEPGCAEAGRQEADTARRELLWATQLAGLGAEILAERLARESSVADLPPETRRDIASRLDPILSQRDDLWLLRSRPGGSAASAARLQPLRERLS